MEGLEKLEQVQRMIHLLRSAGISDEDPDSERFLADFTFLMMQHYGKLDITSKCQLISRHMSKISSFDLGGALQCGGKGCSHVQADVQTYCDDKTNTYPACGFSDDVAMVGMDAMIRSNSTLEDFCRSYFMFHEMDVNRPQSIFIYLPMLSFTETYIYQLDGLNEKLLQLPKDGVPDLGRDLEIDDLNLGAPFRPLLIQLESRGLLTERRIEVWRRILVFGEKVMLCTGEQQADIH